MRRLMTLAGACLLAAGTLATPAAAKSKDDSACHLKSYSGLVGQNISQARYIGDNYRLIAMGSDPGPAQPSRLTIFYDQGSDRIVSVVCG